MGILLFTNNIIDMFAIYPYRLFESSSQIRKNSLAHCSWDSGHYLFNVINPGNRRQFIGVYSWLLRNPQRKIQWHQTWAPKGPWNIFRHDISFLLNILLTTAKESLYWKYGMSRYVVETTSCCYRLQSNTVVERKKYVTLLCSDQNLVLLSGLAHFRTNGCDNSKSRYGRSIWNFKRM